MNSSAEFVEMVTVASASLFTFVDYTVFGALLLVSLGIGLYFGFFSKEEQTTEEYLQGGHKMHPLPIAISLVARSPIIFVYLYWTFNYIIELLIINDFICCTKPLQSAIGHVCDDIARGNLFIWLAVCIIIARNYCHNSCIKLSIHSSFLQ